MNILLIGEPKAWEQAALAVRNWATFQDYALTELDVSEISEARLAKSAANEPQAIIYAGEVNWLPKVTRAVRAVYPNTQLVIIGPEDQRGRYTENLRITPSFGTFWKFASLQNGELDAALKDAVRATRQRSQFRKTIMGLNQRLKENRPSNPQDYDRLVVSDWLLASVLRASQDGILVINRNLRVLEWNPSCERLFGLERLKAVGRKLMELVGGSDAPILETCIQSILSTGKSIVRELVLRAPTGRTIEIEATFNLVPAIKGSSQEFVAIQVRDISQRRKMDRMLMSAKEAAESANRTKSEFLANMSHEIRTPMTSIIGFAEILEERFADGEDLEFIRTIKQNGEFLLRIINDILDISKIEAGRMEIERERLSPIKLAETVAEMMRVRAEKRGQKFDLQITQDVPEKVIGDPVRIRQILINLVGNAIKFTPPGGSVSLTVARSNGFVSYQIQDTGPGISDDQQEEIFAPFAQGGQVSRNYGGTGLGLTISRRLARMMNGDVKLESVPGKGSTFTLLIPYIATLSGQK